MSRRKAKSIPEFMAHPCGPNMRDARKIESTGKDRTTYEYNYSHNHFDRQQKRVAADSVNVNDRPIATALPVGMKRLSKAERERLLAEMNQGFKTVAV